MTFHANGAQNDTIERLGTGSWISDGFRAGQSIQVQGNSGTPASRGKFYDVLGVTATIITLGAKDAGNTCWRTRPA